MNNRIKIIVVQRIFASYRKPIFDRLSANYNLLLLHSADKSGVEQVNATYSKRVRAFRYLNKNTNLYLHVIPYILKFRPSVIIHEFNPSILSLHISFLLSKFLKSKFIIWGQGFNRRKGFNINSVAGKIRFFYLKKADAIIVYGLKAKQTIARYIDSNKIFIAFNTLDTQKYRQLLNIFKREGKLKIKNELGIKTKYNLIYIGRLLDSKFPEYLLLLYERLIPLFKDDLAIHFIGDGKSKISLMNQTKKRGFNNIYFHGAIYDDILSGKYLFISDLMVMPGELGLSIIHSFCFECPVVSLEQKDNGPFHGPEIEYIINGKTGYLARNIEEMSEFIKDFLLDEKKQIEYKENIHHCISNLYSIDNMIQVFKDVIEYVLELKIG